MMVRGQSHRAMMRSVQSDGTKRGHIFLFLLLLFFVVYVANLGSIFLESPFESFSDVPTIKAEKKEDTNHGGSAWKIPFDCVADSATDGKNVFLTKTAYPFYIALRSKEEDSVRWPISEEGRYYERVQEDAFTEILQKMPNTRVIDVGANIGYFSLHSASAGVHAIDSFEPNLKNVERLCESIRQNRWDGSIETSSHVRVYPVGISNQAGEFEFHIHSNPGASAFSTQVVDVKRPTTTMLPVITLDQFAHYHGYLAEDSVPISILKVDVEGLEGQVLLGGKDLLRSGKVHNIFMELNIEQYVETLQEAFNLLIDANFTLFKIGGWMGPGNPNPWVLDENLVATMKTSSDKTQNLWWQLKATHG